MAANSAPLPENPRAASAGPAPLAAPAISGPAPEASVPRWVAPAPASLVDEAAAAHDPATAPAPVATPTAVPALKVAPPPAPAAMPGVWSTVPAAAADMPAQKTETPARPAGHPAGSAPVENPKKPSDGKKEKPGRLVVGIVAFLIGGLAFSLFVHRQPKEEPAAQAPAPAPPAGLSLAQDSGKFFDDLFSRAYFDNSRRPFEDMQRIERSLLARYLPPEQLRSGFSDWYKQRFGGGDPTDVKETEDEKSVTYRISLMGLAPTNLKVTVKDSVIHVTGNTDSSGGQGSGMPASGAAVTFWRAYPIPTFFNQAKFKVARRQDEVAVTFPKDQGNYPRSPGAEDENEDFVSHSPQ